MHLKLVTTVPGVAWAARIRERWQQSTEAIFEVGRLLCAAKRSLPHGAFQTMVREGLPFGPRTAQRLMKLATSPVANATYGSHLPPHWRTLAELSKLSATRLEESIAAHRVRPDMELVDAERLVRQLQPLSDPHGAVSFWTVLRRSLGTERCAALAATRGAERAALITLIKESLA